MVRCGSKYGYQKAIMCLKEITLRAHIHIMSPILGSIVNKFGGPVWPLNCEHDNLHFGDA